MAKSWFPGHMKKAIDQITEYLKLIDVVIEVVDARAPKASSNPNLVELLEGKPRVIALNKSDLADPFLTRDWLKHLNSTEQAVVECNCNTGDGVNRIIREAKRLTEENPRKKSLISSKVRALVIGLPNVGKSSFINRTAKKVKAKVADKPGVTRTKQWIQVDAGLELLDTPGIMPPRVDDISVWFCLSTLGIIGDKLLEHEALALSLIAVLNDLYPESVRLKYNLAEGEGDPHYILEGIGTRRGCLRQGGVVDMEKASEIFLKDFKQGSIKKISLECPMEEINYEKYMQPYFPKFSLDEDKEL